MYIAHEIRSWPNYFDNVFTLRNFWFGVVKLAKNADPDEYFYPRYGILFDVRGTFSLPNRSFGKNVVIFGADMSSSVHINNNTKYIFDSCWKSNAKVRHNHINCRS